jgi:putative glutamine amidotransferase
LSTYRDPARWGVWDEPADLLPTSYARAVTGAGGAPMLLPPGSPASVRSVLDGLHGLIIAGGADVDPQRYGADRGASTGPAAADRDGWELALVTIALEIGLPLLAICRGLQVLNVALGGDLVQHLPDLVGTDLHCPTVGRHGRHQVELAAGSLLAEVFGPAAEVATYHHQAVNRLGDGLVATAWSADGVIEAAEGTRQNWIVGVQWHPEVAEYEPDSDGVALFETFVQSAAGYRDR